jgi:hypothetical protein
MAGKLVGISVCGPFSHLSSLAQLDTHFSALYIVIALVPSMGMGKLQFQQIANSDSYRILDPGCYQGRNDLGAYGGKVYRFIVYSKHPIS